MTARCRGEGYLLILSKNLRLSLYSLTKNAADSAEKWSSFMDFKNNESHCKYQDKNSQFCYLDVQIGAAYSLSPTHCFSNFRTIGKCGHPGDEHLRFEVPLSHPIITCAVGRTSLSIQCVDEGMFVWCVVTLLETANQLCWDLLETDNEFGLLVTVLSTLIILSSTGKYLKRSHKRLVLSGVTHCWRIANKIVFYDRKSIALSCCNFGYY